METIRRIELLNIEDSEINLEKEKAIHDLISEIKNEIGYYQRSETIKAALDHAKKTGDLEPLKKTGYFDDIAADQQALLNRPDIKGNLRKELAVITAFDFLSLPVREIERSKMITRKKQLISKSKSGILTKEEEKELELLSQKTLELNYRDAHLSIEVANFLIRNGYQSPEIVKKFWDLFSTLELEPKTKREIHAGLLGAVAIFYLIRESQMLNFRFSDPEEDVKFAIDGYIQDKEKIHNYPIQIKNRSEYIVYENENPEDTIILRITPNFRLDTLPHIFKPLKKDIARFANGLKQINAKEGFFVVIPGKIKTQDNKYISTIDHITAKPTEKFKHWFSRVFSLFL